MLLIATGPISVRIATPMPGQLTRGSTEMGSLRVVSPETLAHDLFPPAPQKAMGIRGEVDLQWRLAEKATLQPNRRSLMGAWARGRQTLVAAAV
jgi:hypothetical protein